MEKAITGIVENVFHVSVEPIVTRPSSEYGDYATNIALQLASSINKPPREVAETIAEHLRKSGEYSEVSVAGPGFINIRVNGRDVARQLDEVWVDGDTFGENNDGNGKTVIVEYPSPNMAKPYSVGHLRPANQGWAARQLMQATGWTVITDNHLGDYGTPLGIWITGFRAFSSDEALAKDGVYELGRVYIATKKALKEEAERGESVLADEVQNWLHRYEMGDAEATEYSQRFNTISLDHIHTIMNRLHISTDYELGEAFFAPRGKEAVKTLIDKKVAVQNDDGSIIVPLDDVGIDVPLLVQKSNGTALYATNDLATLLYREERWHPDRVIYVVGAEQQFYFTQLFAMAKKLGITTELIHLWFGVIDQQNDDGSREKMSSRKGVVLMEDLLNQAEEHARAIVKDKTISEDDIKKIALGAIKFTDFVSDRRTNILFDWKTIFALSGMSGPYVQYAAVRVNKIMSDYGGGVGFDEHYDYVAEKQIILNILDYPTIVRHAAQDLEPHKVANYLYNLARQLNRYYEQTPIATSDVPAEITAARLGVLRRASHVLSHGLLLLGIEVPSRM